MASRIVDNIGSDTGVSLVPSQNINKDSKDLFLIVTVGRQLKKTYPWLQLTVAANMPLVLKT